MPIIASALVPVNFKNDRTVERLFLEDLLKQSGPASVPDETVRNFARNLAGDGIIYCDPGFTACEVNPASLQDLIRMLQNMRSG